MSIKIKDCLFYEDTELFKKVNNLANTILFSWPPRFIGSNLKVFIKRYAEKRGYHLKILCLPFNDEQVWGLFYEKGGIYFIVINTDLPINKQNVALAHEFYHFIDSLESGEEAPVDVLREVHDNHEYDISDKKANAFSSCLLMPEDLVNFMLDKEPSTIQEKVGYVKSLMDIFMVPFKTAAIRAYELNKLTVKEVEMFLDLDKMTVKTLDKIISRLRYERWEQKFNNVYDIDDLDRLVLENESYDFISKQTAKKIQDKVEEILKKLGKNGESK